MSLGRVERQSVFKSIQQKLRSYILENELEPGDMLPPAAEMVSRLGVSPASFREALRALESLGVVETRHGVGTFICAYDFSPILENLSLSLLFERDHLRDLVQVREALEVGLLPRAMQSMNGEHLQRLEAVADRMRHTDDEGDDHQFHRTLFECLGNDLLLQLIDIFWVVYHDLTARHALQKTRQGDRWYAHNPILEAIKRGDVGAATEALRGHFDDVKGRLIAD